jgi:uncharacterized protein
VCDWEVQIGNDDDDFRHDALSYFTMKLTLEAKSQVNLIRSYSAAEVRVGELRLQSSCIITADTVIADWEPRSLAELSAAHLEKLFALRPEVVLLGTGLVQRFAPAAIRAVFAERRVGLEAMDLGAACRTFNVLVQEDRRVAAALFFSAA